LPGCDESRQDGDRIVTSDAEADLTAAASGSDAAPTSASKHQPPALKMLFFAEMWERFSFYGMRALLVFYMTEHFDFSDNAAYATYGSYTALVYATPVLGGLIADRILGFRKAVLLGGVLMALGHFAMAVDNLSVFYLALGLLICGNGFFKPNISSIVGRLYAEDDPRRDAGFTFFYMGINLGALVSGLACGFIGKRYGWHWGFGLAGVGMLIGLASFWRGQAKIAGLAEPPPGVKSSYPPLVYAGAAVAVLIAWKLVQSSGVVGVILAAAGVLVLSVLFYTMVRHCTKKERDQLLVAIVLTLFSIVFWAFFEQAGSSLNLFTERNVDREVLGLEIEAPVFQSVNPAFILLFGPVFAWLWLRMARNQIEPSTPVKFGLGIVQLGLGFAALYLGARSSDDGIVALIWLILGYLLHTTGELCLSPVGLSMITKLSPARMTGLMMGTWFLSSAFAQYVASLIAMLTGVKEEGAEAALPPPSETVMVYGSVFGKVAIVALGVGVFVVLIAPFLRRRMHGTH
jgi:proton-dependent oligopeptide transporter, POT family